VSAPAPDAGSARHATGRARVWQGLLGVAISIGFLAWALKGVRLADILGHLGRAHPAWYLASCIAATSTFLIRAVRWRILLVPVVGQLRFRPVWHATAIGFMANNVLPARAGELVKAYAGARLLGVPFVTSLASIVVERIFDGVTIGLLLALAIGAGGFRGATLGGTTLGALATAMIVGFLGILLFALALARARQRVLPLAERALARLLPARLSARAGRLLHALTDGLAALHSTRDALRVLTWSFALWLVNASSYVLAYRSRWKTASFWPLLYRLSPPTKARTPVSICRLK